MSAATTEAFFQRVRESRRGPASQIEWLEEPVGLWPRRSRVMVLGVAADADPAVGNYWLALGKSAPHESANATRTESP
jgi:hypothetical protein